MKTAEAWQMAGWIFVELGKIVSTPFFLIVVAHAFLEGTGTVFPPWTKLNTWPPIFQSTAVCIAVWGLLAYIADTWLYFRNLR